MTAIALPWLLNIFLSCLVRFCFFKAFGKHLVLPLTKEKCEENVLEAMAILPAYALERRGLRYCVSFQLAQYRIVLRVLCAENSSVGIMENLLLKGGGKCGRDKKRIIFPLSLAKYCLLILITVFTDFF